MRNARSWALMLYLRAFQRTFNWSQGELTAWSPVRRDRVICTVIMALLGIADHAPWRLIQIGHARKPCATHRRLFYVTIKMGGRGISAHEEENAVSSHMHLNDR